MSCRKTCAHCKARVQFFCITSPIHLKTYLTAAPSGQITRVRRCYIHGRKVTRQCWRRTLGSGHADDGRDQPEARDYTVRPLALSADRGWEMRRQHLSPRYTTRLDEVLKVKACWE
ncbi:MAG TPA: DUF4113 domain-containing protein [Pyrinomonadaceae bacterium]